MNMSENIQLMALYSAQEQTGEVVHFTGYSECLNKQVVKSNPANPYLEDRKFTTLTSSEEDGMKYHDLHDLVFYISE